MTPTTALAGPISLSELSPWRRWLLVLACVIAYVVASAVLQTLPSLFAPRP